MKNVPHSCPYFLRLFTVILNYKENYDEYKKKMIFLCSN